MKSINKVLICLLLTFTLAVITGTKAYAAPGETTNEYPNTSVPGGPKSYAVSELCSTNTDRCMKGAQTWAIVYVPLTIGGTTSVGQNVVLTIEDGCDTTTVDNNNIPIGPAADSSLGYTANTRYDVLDNGGNVLGTVTTPANQPATGLIALQCISNPNLTLTFRVPAGASRVDGYYRIAFRTTALTPNDGNSYYRNYYRIVSTLASGVLIDRIDNTYPCDLATYQYSCPKLTIPGVGVFGQSYSSVGMPGNGFYGQQYVIDTVCNVGDARLDMYMYDLDTGVGITTNNYGQTNIRGQITGYDSSGTLVETIPNPALPDRSVYPNATFYPSAATGFPFSSVPASLVGNDVELNVFSLSQNSDPLRPGHVLSEPYGYAPNQPIMLKQGRRYILRIDNLSVDNSLQVLLKTSQYHPSKNCMPIGYFDTCSLVAGVTHFYGWAYDSDSTTSAEPQVSLSLSGTSSVNSGNIPTDKNLRTAAIETYLGGVRPGMPLVQYYGFDWTASGLVMGGNYTVGGNILNTGGGDNASIKYDTSFFPSGKVPASCLPSTPPGTLSCPNTRTAGIATFSEQEYGLPGTLSVYVIGAGTVPTATSATITVAGLPNPVVTLLAPNPPPANTSSPIASAGVTFPNPGDYAVAYVVSWAGGSVSCNAAVSVYSLPYLKAFGADIIAGSGFGTGSCSSASGGVYGFAQPTGGFRGASAQFGITSLLNVNGVYSASQRASAPVPAKGLTFSNSTGVGDTTYGGASGGGSSCISDYFSVTRDASLASGAFGGSLAPGLGKRQYTLAGGSTIGALNIPRGTQAAVYVNGNVFISGDIIYDTAARSGVSDIPYFALIVRNGNIYIAPGVSRLDGVFIAQPTDFTAPGSLGRIYTCAPGDGSLYSAAQLSTACDDQPLAINGALIAQQIKFLRTLNTLRESTIGETPSFIDGSRGAAYKAAETINYNPEIYLAPSPLRNPNSPPGADVFGVPDAIFSLPPVF